MIKIGITGQGGFVGSHLFHTIGLFPEQYTCISFEKSFFESDVLLDGFVAKCDVIVHLAAMNRHHDQQFIYDTNLALAEKLVASLERVSSKAHVVFSSSSQEERDNLYGKSKKQGRELLAAWAERLGGKFTGLIIPNVFGPFGKPDYNSFIATFCYRLTHDEQPRIDVDGQVKLIYVGELVKEILSKIKDGCNDPEYYVPHTADVKVSEVLGKLECFRDQYLHNGEIPALTNIFDLNLFNTFRSYIDLGNYFPKKFTQHTDSRGSFVEIIRLGIGGQVSFSTTHPGITRGNHYHTRKIERFAVIKGKALIQLRKVGTDEVLNFELDGDEPAYVDMPVWYTHNIKNIGQETLYTNFWINEPYNPEDADTWMETV